MKYILTILSIFILLPDLFGQEYRRVQFDYENMAEPDFAECSIETQAELHNSLQQIEHLNSTLAVQKAKAAFDKKESCSLSFGIYSWVLFRNGEWMKAQAIIDSALQLFGADPDLILRRAEMNKEMGELGVGVRNIDGMSVYLSQKKKLKYDEDQFKEENYKAALSDLKYIADNYQDRFQEIYTVGYLYQVVGDLESSILYLDKLSELEDYKDHAAFINVDNYIGLKKYPEAEKILDDLESRNPQNAEIQQKFVELFKASGQEERIELKQKSVEYYSWVPEYADIPFTDENYDMVRYFLEDHSPEEKIARLEELIKKDEAYAVSILVVVLNTHGNHGNGVENKSEEMLIKIGEPAVLKVISLMENCSSTCTVTKAASILAEIKDPRGWQPMIDYLPRTEHLPMTMIPPSVPKQIIKFDRERALVALLTWIHNQDKVEESNSDDPMADLAGIFSAGAMYTPLEVYKKKEVIKCAQTLKFSADEIDELISNIYGK